MKKDIKIFLIIFAILVVIVLVDTIQAKVFDNKPFIKITEDYNGGNVYRKDKGIFVYTYNFSNGEKVTVFRWEKYAPDEKIQNLADTNQEINKDVNLEGKEQNNEMEEIKIKVGSEILNMKLEQNEATKALVEKLKQGDITVNTSEYGSFEQVGNLGFSLPRNDTQIKTKVGDVMLYQGNQISIFYASNSWSYTKLGEITNKTESELKNIFGSSNATLVLSIN